MRFLTVFIFISGAVLFQGCNKDEEKVCPALALDSLQFGFETNLIDWTNEGGDIERQYESNIQISTEQMMEGSSSVKFTVTPNSYINGGTRAELIFDQQLEAGDITTYEYSFFVPLDYQDAESLKDQDGNPNWQVLSQWKDQPDTCVGETWTNYPETAPPIAIYYNYFTKADSAYLDFLADPSSDNIYGLDKNWDQVSTISLSYGFKTVAIAQINKGEWNTLRFNIKWNITYDAYAEVWLNDVPLTNGKVTGRNMINNASHYFKFGLYRNDSISSINSVYFDKLLIQ